MIQTAGYVLLITESSRADELAAYADDDMEFAESVPSFSVLSRDRLIALLSLSPGFITHVSRAKRGRTSATWRSPANSRSCCSACGRTEHILIQVSA